ncbi:O-antigen ligase family protein [Bradyrhizobium sp. USDA 329]|uniref:O-antigen ligase family protein n=1 Tax=unclassified Bradyrhizobium TaxID=2631580 RepID=UPI0035195D16
MPSYMTIYVGGAKFIPARIVIVLLLVPALTELFQRSRWLRASDFFVCAASAWMLAAVLETDQGWSSAAALILEFSGGYFVARSYFFGRRGLEAFVRVLKPVTAGIVAVAVLEHLTQHNVVAALMGLPSTGYEYRYGLLRATSTFPHAILYGSFCAVAGAVFLYSERSFFGRSLYCGLCLFGCVLAMSSAPLMAFGIVLSVYCYDQLLLGCRWRWHALVASLFTLLGVVFLVANKPISWIVANLTLDPATGYFRVATWESAGYYIDLSPYVGYGFGSYASPDDFFGNASVDSVWLTLALRFGIPLVVFILLANITAFLPSRRTASIPYYQDAYMSNMRTAFTLGLAMFMFVGLTVHYWNSSWILWGIWIGIRASLKEESVAAVETPVLYRQGMASIDRDPTVGQATRGFHASR